ncbi:hypothetical protein B0H19DRAFT_1313425 [Mycena capillaripes]|nr:hypothetical protein B0H19DRAFT_1313425 [Mycena capillaripes]
MLNSFVRFSARSGVFDSASCARLERLAVTTYPHPFDVLISCESGATQTRYAQFDRLCSGVPPIEPTCLRLRYHIEFEVLNLTPCHPIAISNAPAPPFILLMVFDANGGRHHQCVDLIFVVSIRSIHTADDHTSVSTCLAAPDSSTYAGAKRGHILWVVLILSMIYCFAPMSSETEDPESWSRPTATAPGTTVFLGVERSCAQEHRLRWASTYERTRRARWWTLSWRCRQCGAHCCATGELIFCGEGPIDAGTQGSRLWSRKDWTHYVFLPGAVSPPIKEAKSSNPSAPSSSGQTTALHQWSGHAIYPRPPRTRSTARTPEVARIEAQLAAAFGRSMAEGDAASTSADAEALAVLRRAVEVRDRILPPPPMPPLPITTSESATEDREIPDQMEVDMALPALVPFESDAAAPPAPPPGPTAPLAPAPPAAPTATAVYRDDNVHPGAEDNRAAL